MTFKLPELPYALDALQPYLSRETLEYHHGKHHAAYVNNLNKLVEGTEFADASLEDVIKKSKGGLYNNAAQIWNHTFYWNCLTPKGGGLPQGKVATRLNDAFGSFEKFRELFSQAGATLFGSGWVFLVQNRDGKLEITQEGNAGNPMTKGQKPLLTCDVWEHAYYIDYRNARPKYVDAFWDLLNWSFVEKSLG